MNLGPGYVKRDTGMKMVLNFPQIMVATIEGEHTLFFRSLIKGSGLGKRKIIPGE